MEIALKKEIKTWEHRFKRENGRNPTKTDIASSSPEIRTLYKKYRQVKENNKVSKSNCVSFDSENNPWDKPVEIAKKITDQETDNSFNDNFFSNIKKAVTSSNFFKHTNSNVPAANVPNLSEPEQNQENLQNESVKFDLQIDNEKIGEVKLSETPAAFKSPIANNKVSELIEETNLQSIYNSKSSNHKLRLGSILGKSICNVKFLNDDFYSTKPNKESFIIKEGIKENDDCLRLKQNSLKRQLPVCDTQSSVNISITEVTESPAKKSNVNRCSPDDVTQNSKVNSTAKEINQKVKAAPKSVKNPADGNYVKINLKVKRFSRKGTSKQNFLRKQKFREKLNRRKASSVCFRCNQEGHWANKCPLRYLDNDQRNQNHEEFNEIVANVTKEDYKFADLNNLDAIVDDKCPLDEVSDVISESCPLQISDSDLQKSLNEIGYKNFRANQQQVIQRVLEQKSTLLMMPTGGGKSLCYQLPARLFQLHQRSVALVISPLISLMQDQLTNLPKGVKGIALNSSLNKEQRTTVLSDAKNGVYSFIMISPEALVDYEFIKPYNLPPISFACIDEAHCLADWSHHFRPSYMRVCKVLRSKFNVKCFLGLSATCTESTLLRICRHLSVDDPISGCFRSDPLPKNLLITASRDPNRDEALINLLRRDPFVTCNSILVYCATRDQTIRVASLIRIALKDEPVQIKKIKWVADAYHAGLTTTERTRIQNRFMQGSLRILTATVAFGMGLDKSNLYAVIHYSRPKSFENYVQEIGRAGRDGKPANCHVFLPPMNIDTYIESNDLKRHVFSNHVDLPILKRFVRNLFFQCDCSNKCIECAGHIRALPVQNAVQDYDLREETLATLLCYLELHPLKYLCILPSGYLNCTVRCYKGAKQLAELSHKSLIVSAALSIQQEQKCSRNLSIDNSLNINLVELADRFGWNLNTMRKELSALEWTCDENKRYVKSGVMMEFSTMSWLYWLPKGNISSCDLDKIVSYVESRIFRLESAGVFNMEKLCSLLDHAALNSVDEFDPSDDRLKSKSSEIQTSICDHFQNASVFDNENFEDLSNYAKCYVNESSVRSNIRHFINIYIDEHQLTGRAIASVMHGMSTPLYPAIVWSKVKKFWRCQLDVDWLTLKRWADEELRQTLL